MAVLLLQERKTSTRKKGDKQKENIQKTDKHKLTLVTPSLLGVKRFADVWEKGK